MKRSWLACSFASLTLSLSPSFSLSQEKPPPPVSKALMEARKKAVAELVKMKEAMAKKGQKAEVGDCDSIMAKLCAPEKNMPQKGAFAPFPGEKEYAEILAAWVELSTTLAGIYKDCAANLTDAAEQEQVEIFQAWIATWPEIAKGIRHLNARRKMCKLPPVSEDWSGSWGGFLHGRYLKLNAKDPSVAGLGAHDENPKLPGATTEGAEAGRAILGAGGTPEMVMDSWLGSRFHRSPVFDVHCGRVSFGGYPGGWWACPNAGGMSGKALADVITWPGDGDSGIATTFGGEAPNPFPQGMTSSGTIIIVQFLRSRPKKPVWRLLDPDSKEVPIVLLDQYENNAICFVAKEPLKGQTKYSVEVVGQDGSKIAFSFTTQ